MIKVSKNIKKFRVEANLTQDALAQKISVTRQTVSSWETGRTQPDVEMLEQLSNALGKSLEELIYGEKHKVGFEPQKTDNRKIIAIILASLGSILTVLGLIIMFIVIWEEMPSWVLPSLMFVPLLAGAGVSVFAYLKKQSSIPWCECASAAWVAGLVATTCLIIADSNTFIRSLDTSFILSTVTLLILPIPFIMKSLTGITAFSINSIWWSIFTLEENKSIPIWLIGTLLLHACGFVYTAFTNRNDIHKKISLIINILACAFNVGFVCAYFSSSPVTAAVSFIITFFLALYAADNGAESVYHFRIVAVPLLVFFSSFICFGAAVFVDNTGAITLAEPLPWIMLAMLLTGIYFGKSSFNKNPLKISFCISSLISVLVQIAHTYVKELSYFDQASLKFFLLDLLAGIAMVSAAASAIALIINGVKCAKMSTVNLGLIAVFSVIISALIQMDFELIVYGIACVIMGAVLLVINNRMSKAFKVKEDERND